MTIRKTVDALLTDAVGRRDVPGVVAMATDRKGAIYEGGFGRRVLGRSDEMTTDTVVWIASMTKALTGLAAMQFVERGKLSLDAPAADIRPELGKVGVLTGFDATGKPRTRAPRRPITLRHLLTHTAGFSYDAWNADIVRYQTATETPDITSCKEKALTTPLLFDPGDRWEYGISIDWAGKMIEAVSGMTLGAYLTGNVLMPMGMTDTAFKLTPAMRNRLAKLHRREDDDSLTPIDFEIPQDPEFEMGGGGLYGTAGDYLQFVRLMLNKGEIDGNQLISPETAALMSKNAMGSNRVTLLKTVIPRKSNDAEFFPGVEKSWGLSFQINEQLAPTGRSAGSLAWAGLANTYYWIDQTRGVGGVYLTQISPFADKKSMSLFYAFEKAIYDGLAG